MTERISVLLVEDHRIVRQGVRALLEDEPDMVVVGEAGSGEEAIPLVVRLRPDIVLMDIGLPGMDGIVATRRIKAAVPDAKVLILTMHAEEKYLLPVVEAGGSGYVLKGATHTDLSTAIRTVFAGDVFLYPNAVSMLVRHLLGEMHAGGEWKAYETLSEREREVLRLVAEGHTSKEIAQALKLSPKTVDSYRERIAIKVGIRRRADLLRFALTLGLIKPRDG